MVQGLASLCGTPIEGVLPSLNEGAWEPAGEYLVVLDDGLRGYGGGDVARWVESIMQFEDRWCGPMLDLLKSGRLSKLVIDSVGKEFIITRQGLSRFWKRRRPIRNYLH